MVNQTKAEQVLEQLDGVGAGELVDAMLERTDAEQLLSVVLARIEGKNLEIEMREEARFLTDEEREELRRYLRGQGLSERYTYETLKCVAQLERPEERGFNGPDPPPVPCRHPSEEDWIERRAFELDWWDGSGTNNRRKALRHVCRWQGQQIWPSLEGRIPPANKEKRPVPTREIVAEITGTQHKDSYWDRLCRHVAHFLAHTGRRISEARDLKVGDVNWEANEIHLWSEKQDAYRFMRYEPFIVTAPNGPSLKHYVDYVRPEPQEGHEETLFLTKSGRQFSYSGLHSRLNKWGKEIWPEFYSHSLRKYAATTMLVENDYDITRTAIRLGIQAKSVEKHYLDDAVIRNEMGTDFTMPRVRQERDS